MVEKNINEYFLEKYEIEIGTTNYKKDIFLLIIKCKFSGRTAYQNRLYSIK